MKKEVPVLLKNSTTSIYYNFDENKLYEVKFEGALTRAFSGNQKANTFFLSLVIMYVIAPIFVLLLNQFVFKIYWLALMISFLVGWTLGVFLVRLVLSEITDRTEMKVSKLVVKKMTKEIRRNGIILKWTIAFFIAVSVIGSLIALGGRESSQFIFYNGASAFVISSVWKSSYPRQMVRASKKMKKQMKEGKFDD